MPTNDFLPFAHAGGANVVDQATYAGLTTLLDNGFVAGVALSEQLNKVWRQSSIMAAMIGQFIVDQAGTNAVDNGTIATLEADFIAAIRATAVSAGLPYGADTGALNAIVVTPSPAVGSLTAGLGILVKVANTNTAAVTINVNGLGAVSVVNTDGSAAQAGQMVANGLVFLVYDGSHFQMLSMPPLSFFLGGGGSGSPTDFFGTDTGAANTYVVTTVPAFVSLSNGARFRARIANTNTGDSTVDANGTGAVQILSAAAAALQGGELQAGGYYEFVYDQPNAKWRLLASALGPLAGEDPTHTHHFTTVSYMNTAIAAAIASAASAAAAISNVRSVMREWPLVPPIAGTYRFTLRAPVAGTINSLSWSCGTAGASFTVNVRINGTSVTGLSAVNVNSTTTTTTNATAANTYAAGDVIDVVVSSVSTSPAPIGSAVQLNYIVTG